jgi:hypothetical protein
MLVAFSAHLLTLWLAMVLAQWSQKPEQNDLLMALAGALVMLFRSWPQAWRWLRPLGLVLWHKIRAGR